MVEPSRRRRWLEPSLVQRALTASVLLAAFLAALLWLPRALFAFLVAGVVGLAAMEWGRLTGLPTVVSRLYALTLACAFGVLLWLTQALAAWTVQPWMGVLFATASLFWIVVAPAWMAHGVRAGTPHLLAAAGVLVLLPGALAMVLLPPTLVLGTLALVWIADSAAYFAGRSLGRHKLAPAISPGKTWEGVGGGFVLVAALAITVALWRDISVAVMLPFCLAVAAISIVGDLTVSMFKRTVGVKDSGTLFPGHGGVLDRIDSVAAAAPLFVLGLFTLGLV